MLNVNKASYEIENTAISLFESTSKNIGIICIQMDGGIIGAFDFICACLYFSTFLQ